MNTHLSKNQPVIIGGMVMDLRGFPTNKLQLYTSNPGHLHQIPGGVGRNICENLYRLGVNPLLITAVGDDVTGESLLAHSKELGLDCTGIYRFNRTSTAIYLAILNQAGDLHTAIADMSIFDQLTPECILAFETQLTCAPLIIIDANLPKNTLQAISNFCKQKQIPLWVEPVSVEKSQKLLSSLDKITYLSPNVDELAALSGVDVHSFVDIPKAGEIILQKGIKHLLITAGPDGVIHGDSQGFQHFPAIQAQIADVTGAGDSFVAGTVFGLLKGFNIQQSIQYGLITAKITVEATETVSSKLSSQLIQTYFSEYYMEVHDE